MEATMWSTIFSHCNLILISLNYLYLKDNPYYFTESMLLLLWDLWLAIKRNGKSLLVAD